ncbi:MAG: hypothetical protein NTY19_42160 [Planctomycetota bacterium]|nr:hypothetical protein [Planctomycetota bacterium]
MSDPTYVTKAKQALSLGKKILFLEGIDDEAVYTKWLEKLDPLFAARLEIIDCEGQQKVSKGLALLGNPPNVFGIQDRDEWDSAQIAAMQAAHPRLFVNPDRHTLESYCCDPQEITLALLNQDPATFGPQVNQLTAEITAGLADWVDHGALWTSLMRVQNAMQEAKLPHFFNQIVPIPPDATIRTRMQQWRTIVDDVDMFAAFAALRTHARSQTQSKQLQSCVYAPLFFTAVVLPKLQQLQPSDERTWKVNLAEWSPNPPPDVVPLLQAVLA